MQASRDPRTSKPSIAAQPSLAWSQSGPKKPARRTADQSQAAASQAALVRVKLQVADVRHLES